MMIFKYFTYDKITKDWADTKSYFSICVPANTKDKDLRSLFYNKLIKQRRISMPYDHFSFNDNSNYPNIKTFTVSIVKENKKWYVCRLTQLPDKENAVNNAKIKSSWSNMIFSSSPRMGTLSFTDPWSRPIEARAINPSWTINAAGLVEALPVVQAEPVQQGGYGQPVIAVEPVRLEEPRARVRGGEIWDDENIWLDEPI